MGDPEHCREMGDIPDDPGVANAWDSSGEPAGKERNGVICMVVCTVIV